jgi:hypothetical protein
MRSRWCLSTNIFVNMQCVAYNRLSTQEFLTLLYIFAKFSNFLAQ